MRAENQVSLAGVIEMRQSRGDPLRQSFDVPGMQVKILD